MTSYTTKLDAPRLPCLNEKHELQQITGRYQYLFILVGCKPIPSEHHRTNTSVLRVVFPTLFRLETIRAKRYPGTLVHIRWLTK